MAYSSSTTNYHLPLPTDDDRSNWTDNNEAFQTIDNAIHENATELASLAERVAALESAQPQSLAGFVKVDTENGTGLQNSEYSKLVIQQ